MASDIDYLSAGSRSTPDTLSDTPEQQAPGELSIVPFWKVGSSEQKVIEWNKSRQERMYPATQARAETQLNNAMLYRGVHFMSQGDYGDFRDRNARRFSYETTKVVVNEIFEFTQSTVGMLQRFGTNIEVVPPTREHSDREGAEVTDAIIKTVEYNNRLEKKLRHLDRDALIFGGAPLLSLWDENKGDIHPDWFKALDSYKKKKIRNGSKVKIKGHEFVFDKDRPICIGDMGFPLPDPWSVIFDPQKCREDIQWFSWDYFEHVEKAVFDHPEKEKEIRERATSGMMFDFENASMEKVENVVMITRLFQRSGRYSLDGREVKIIGESVVADHESKYPRTEESEFGNLPIIYHTDIDLPGHTYGYSTYQIIGPIQHTLNQFYSAAKRNALVAGTPKIMVPKQSRVTNEVWGDSISVVKYNHPFKPEIVTSPSVPRELFSLIEALTSKLIQIGGRSETSAGNVPPNVRSAKMIALMEEIEALRQGERRLKKSEIAVELKKKIKHTVGKHYKDYDQRLINILGKDKKPLIESFKVSVLHKSYDFRIVPASGLPDLPQQRIAAVSELMENDRTYGLYNEKKWASLLQIGDPDKYYDDVTAAVDKAEWENQQFINGKIPPGPSQGDDHMTHWETIMTLIRSKAFLDFSESQKEQTIRHAMTHEMEIFDLMEMNPATGQAIMGNPRFATTFPAYYTPAPASPVPPGPGGPGGQQAPAPGPQGPGGAPAPQPGSQPGNGDFLSGALNQ